MAKLTVRSSALLALLATAAAGSACAKTGQPSTTAERAEIAHGKMEAADRMTATVDSVDAANQTVFLHDQDGRKFAVQADQDAMQRLSPKDEIKVVYQESVAFALTEKSEIADQKTKVEDLTELKGDDAIQFGRKVETTVQILAVGAHGSAVEFRAPEGQVRTVSIDDEKSQEKISALRPGDKVAVTYVEKLGLSLDEK